MLCGSRNESIYWFYFPLRGEALVRGTLHGIPQVNSKMVKADSAKGVTLLKSGEDKDFAVKKSTCMTLYHDRHVSSGHSQSSDLLCDGLRIIRTQRIIDGDKVICAVVLDVEERELDRYGVAL